MRRGPRAGWLLPVALLLASAGPAAPQACRPGLGPAACAGTSSVWDNRTRPLTRQDIDARIGAPRAPVAREVTADTARSWQAVRRQPRPPVIAYPSDPPQMERKGDMP
jgi:hypothetical protein